MPLQIYPEKDVDKNKVMKINERWDELKETSHTNIQSEKGIRNRQIRSIQTEGHFGDIKEMITSGVSIIALPKRYTRNLLLYAIGRNINKYHRFLCDKLHKFEGKSAENAA